MEARYIEHAKATAVCVELALGGVAEDIQRELADSSGQLAEALQADTRLYVIVVDGLSTGLEGSAGERCAAQLRSTRA